jgi:hypothetical protein
VFLGRQQLRWKRLEMLPGASQYYDKNNVLIQDDNNLSIISAKCKRSEAKILRNRKVDLPERGGRCFLNCTGSSDPPIEFMTTKIRLTSQSFAT